MIIPNGLQNRITWDDRYGAYDRDVQARLMETVRRVSLYMDQHDRTRYAFDNGDAMIVINRIAGIQNIVLAARSPCVVSELERVIIFAKTTEGYWNRYGKGGGIIRSNTFPSFPITSNYQIIGGNDQKIYAVQYSGNFYLLVHVYSVGLELIDSYTIDLWVYPISAYFGGFGFTRTDSALFDIGAISFDSSGTMYLSTYIQMGAIIYRYLAGLILLNRTTLSGYWYHDYNFGYYDRPGVIEGIAIYDGKVYLADRTDGGQEMGWHYPCIRVLNEADFSFLYWFRLSAWTDGGPLVSARGVRVSADGIYIPLYRNSPTNMEFYRYDLNWILKYKKTYSGRWFTGRLGGFGKDLLFAVTYVGSTQYNEIYKYNKETAIKIADVAGSGLTIPTVIDF